MGLIRRIAGRVVGFARRALSSIGKFASNPLGYTMKKLGQFGGFLNKALGHTPFGHMMKDMFSKMFQNPAMMCMPQGCGAYGHMAQHAAGCGQLSNCVKHCANACGGINNMPQQAHQNLAQITAHSQAQSYHMSHTSVSVQY